VKVLAKIGWREKPGVEHARRWGLPEPDFTSKDRT
jgi:hypothetical protein